MKRTITQNNRLHALLHQLGIDLDTKEVLIDQFTNGRTVRSSEMTRNECQALIKELEVRVGSEADRDKKRKRVIAQLAEAGYITKDARPDMPRIYEWVRRQKHKKHLNAHTSDELSGLIYAAEQVKNHYLQQHQKQRV